MATGFEAELYTGAGHHLILRVFREGNLFRYEARDLYNESRLIHDPELPFTDPDDAKERLEQFVRALDKHRHEIRWRPVYDRAVSSPHSL